MVVPRALRRNLFERLIIPCCLPAWADLTRPEAVILNRFLQLDFVFILGISVSLVWVGLCTTRHATIGRSHSEKGLLRRDSLFGKAF